MNRRDSLRAISLTTLSTVLLLDACKTDSDKSSKVIDNINIEETTGLQDFEVARLKKLHSEKFFTDHELSTFTILADIIIPKDAI